MKPAVAIILFAIVVFACQPSRQVSSVNPSLQEVKDKTIIPEGIAVHPYNGTVYLSSIHHNKIVSLDELGNVKDVISPGQDGFLWGLGMKFSKDGDILFACTANQEGKTALFAIDVSSNKVINKFTHDSARFLNDLVILSDCSIFITDTHQGAVFILQDNQLQLWLKDEKLTWANGIAATPDDKYLFVASGSKGLQRIEIASRLIESATQNKRTDYAIDGLVYADQKLFAAIGWPQHETQTHRLLRFSLNDEQFVETTDTLVINKPYFSCPTTLALHKDQLYALANTNLGIYNRHNQKLDKIMDSLSYPVISRQKIR